MKSEVALRFDPLPIVFLASLTPAFGQTIQRLEALSTQGNSEAMYQLACKYSKGDGVEKNDIRSNELMEKASSAGHPEAMLVWSYAYYYGQPGIKKDRKKAFTLKKKSSDLGSAEASYILALDYSLGFDVPKDLTLYRKYLELAAMRNWGEAQSALGRHYAFGDGGYKPNQIRAYVWFLLAEWNGVAEAKKAREILGREFSYAVIQSAEDQAALLKEKIEKNSRKQIVLK